MKKSEFLSWLREEHQQWEALLDEIGPAHMEQPGVAALWSMKDIIAHLSGWNRNMVAILQAAQRGEAKPATPWPSNLESDDEVNAWIYENAHERSLQEVLEDSQQVFEQLFAAVESFPDSVQIDIYRMDSGKEFYLICVGEQRIPAGEFFYHFHDDHEPDIRAWLARVEQQ